MQKSRPINLWDGPQVKRAETTWGHTFPEYTIHLFDNAFEILSHGLNLHREDILSKKKLKEIVPKSIEVIKINIDEVYLKKVKVIYSQIIKYSTLIQSDKLTSNEVKLVNEIRIANRYLIEAIKGVQSLQANMSEYINSVAPSPTLGIVLLLPIIWLKNPPATPTFLVCLFSSVFITFFLLVF